MELSKLIELGIAAATNENIPAEYSLADVNETLREELKAFNNYSYYRANKNVLFQLIEEIANVVVPKKLSHNLVHSLKFNMLTLEKKSFSNKEQV